MYVLFARSLAAADTLSRRARACVGRSTKSKRESWRKLVTSLNPTPDGVLLVDKAEGMTSHDVVALVRRKLGIRKVGHCGTLDPIATGLLLLTLGRGTKIQDLLMSEDKKYAGTLLLGVTTSTQDRQGEIVNQREVLPFDENKIRAAFEKFCGDFYQMPPMVSAIKHGGIPLYKLARQGKVVEREPRLVHVYRYTVGRIALHDIGETLGCGAHLKSLRRIKSGRFDVDRAISVADIKSASREEVLQRILSL